MPQSVPPVTMGDVNEWDAEVERLAEHGRDREAVEVAVHHLRHDRTTRGTAMGPLEQLDALAPELGRVIGGIRDDQLDNATPCTDFTVNGILDHMLGGAVTFAAAFRGVAPRAAPTEGDKRALVGAALQDLVAAMRTPGALERTIAAPFGDAPGDTFARFVVLDGLVHGWDLATATGQTYDPPDTVVTAVTAFAHVAVPPLRNGETFARSEAPAPPNATLIERLVAFTGRTA